MEDKKKMIEEAIRKNPDSIFIKAHGKFSKKELSILFSDDFMKKMADPKDLSDFSCKEKRIFLTLLKACLDDAKRLSREKEMQEQNTDTDDKD